MNALSVNFSTTDWVEKILRKVIAFDKNKLEKEYNISVKGDTISRELEALRDK